MKALLTGTAVTLGLSLSAANASPFCIGNFCVVDPDKDDAKMFIVKSDDKDSLEVFGSLIKNTSDHDIDITASTLFTSGNGFANIKPAKDTLLEALTFVPAKGVNLDGFFTSAQLQDNSPKCQKDYPCIAAVPEFKITVNGGETTEATFTYNLDKFNGDVHDNGFDEFPEGSAGTRIDSVTLWIDLLADPFVSFKEIKQVTWSPCDGPSFCDTVVINPTGGAPEASTWAMGLIGFGFVSLLAAVGKRKNARTLEA
jgi:hypothetical protein